MTGVGRGKERERGKNSNGKVKKEGKREVGETERRGDMKQQ